MWALEQSVKLAIEQAQRAGTLPTAAQQAEYLANYDTAASESGERILSVAGESAEIEIKGMLTAEPSFLAMLFGGGNTTYHEINAAIDAAEANPEVKDISYRIKSPGGSTDGLFKTLDKIAAGTKPSTALGVDLVASAAYAIASQADTIQAANKATRLGSLGIAASFTLDESEVVLTSTNAPNKRPDVTTEAGKAAVVAELDDIEDLFFEVISAGRGVTREKIIADFGQGGMVLAGDALTRGMIDSIATSLSVVPNTNSTTADNGGNQLEATNMDLKELVAQHPDAYQAAVQVGIDQERDRVGAHLTMGEASGDTKTAFAAIKDGSGMTATLQATYMTAGMNKSDIAARDDDNLEVKASKEDDAPEAGADVAALVEAKLGVGV